MRPSSPDHRPHGVVAPGRRVAAVERIAGAHEIVMRRCAAGRCRTNSPARRGIGGSACRTPAKASIWRALIGLSGSSALTKWLISKRRLEIVKARVVGERKPFLDTQAEPVHAGVDMDRGRAAGPTAHGRKRPIRRSRPGIRGPGAVECRDSRRPCRAEGRSGRKSSPARRRGAPHRFRYVRDEEGLAAGAGKRGDDRLDAAAVGVGLDDGGAFGSGHALAQATPIGGDARKDRWSGCRRLRPAGIVASLSCG